MENGLATWLRSTLSVSWNGLPSCSYSASTHQAYQGRTLSTPTRAVSATGGGAQAVRDAIAASIATLPQHLCRSLAWDQDAEMAQHCLTPRRCRPRRLLLRPPFTLAAWNQREHQRSPPSILPERHRPLQTLKRRHGRRRCSPQRSTPQNPRLEDPSRVPHRTHRLPQTRQCCDDPLNPGPYRGGAVPSSCRHRRGRSSRTPPTRDFVRMENGGIGGEARTSYPPLRTAGCQQLGIRDDPPGLLLKCLVGEAGDATSEVTGVVVVETTERHE